MRPRQDSAACVSLPSNSIVKERAVDEYSSRLLKPAFETTRPNRMVRYGTTIVIERAMPVEGGEALCAPRQGPNKYKTNAPVNTYVARKFDCALNV